MTVKKLIEKLQKLPPDALVIMYSELGNSYNKLSFVSKDDNNIYDADNRAIWLHHITPELEKDGYTKEDVFPGKRCVVLYE